MSSEVYIEDNTITITAIKDGVKRLGDLWDCTQSKYAGKNLFSQPLDGKYINANQVDFFDYRLIDCKSSSDEIKTSNLSEEVSLEFIAGILKRKGSPNFETDIKINSFSDHIICHYQKETSHIDVLPNSKDVLNEFAVEDLIKRNLKATHYVGGITLGVEVRADIFVNQKAGCLDAYAQDIFRKVIFGPVNSKVKSKLEDFDSEDDKSYDKQIYVFSIPTMKSKPRTFKEMFEIIESAESFSDKQEFNPEHGAKVVGVPIRFVLVPIKQLVDVIFEKFYLRLPKKLLEDYYEMLVLIKNFQFPGWMIKNMLKSNESFKIIMKNTNSNLLKNIDEYEKNLIKSCSKYFQKATEALKNYKLKKASVRDLFQIEERFQLECDPLKVFEKIEVFVEQAEEELEHLVSEKSQKSKCYIKILRDEQSLDNFLSRDSENKIWLHKETKATDAVFIRLEEIAEKMMDFDFEIGILVKSITAQMEIFIKVNEKTYNYEEAEKIAYILGIIGAAVGVGAKNELLFYSMNAEYLNFKIPVYKNEKISILNELIRKLISLQNIVVSRSRLATLDLLTRNDNIWKMFMPIDAKQTSFLAIRHLSNLITYFKNVDWIVGNLDIPKMSATGYLFIIKNSEVYAVCLDDFDLIYLKEKCYYLSEATLKFLSPENLKNSLHPERARFSEIIIKIIESHNHKTLGINEYGLESFNEDSNENLLNALELASILHSRINTETNFIAAVAKFALRENEELSPVLCNAGFSTIEFDFHDQVLNDVKRKAIRESIEEILLEIDPLFVKMNIAIQVFNEAINSDENEVEVCNEKVESILNDILKDKNINEEMKLNIVVYNDKDLRIKWAKIKSEIEKFQSQECNEDTYFHAKMLHSVLINKNDDYFCDVLEKYIAKIDLNENIFKSVKNKLFKYLTGKQYNQLISSLAECSHGVKYYILHKGLESYLGTKDAITAICDILTQLSDESIFNEINWIDLWKNNRFVQIIRDSIGDRNVLIKLYQIIRKSGNIDYIPEDIAQKISELRNFESDIKLTKLIDNIDDFIDLLRKIKWNRKIPENFKKILRDSIENNKILFENLEKLQILKLFKWDYNKNIFFEAIEIDRILRAVDIVDKSLEGEEKKIDVDHFNKKYDENEASSESEFRSFKESDGRISDIRESTKFDAKIHQRFISVFGDSKKVIDSKEFFRLSYIIEKPKLIPSELKAAVVKVLPYITQRIKMWGCQALTADNISELISSVKYPDENIKQNIKSPNKPRFGNLPNILPFVEAGKKENKIPLSRLDIVVGLINSVHSIVAQDLLNIMAKFPIALPLIIRELHHKDSYKNLIPWLTQPVIKWESSPGKILENRLFIDKFKMIVTLRIGDTEKGKSGKSTIINQILSAKHMFSYCGEPGADRGKPYTLNGTVEFLWLTQETSSPKLWESVLQNHYKKGINELILLANLHGNALDFKSQLTVLGEIASSYIIFVMPKNNQNLSENWENLEEALKLEPESDKISYVAIDPPPECNQFVEEVIIDTSKIADDANIGKLRNVLKRSLISAGKQLNLKDFRNFGKMRHAEPIETKESTILIEYIKIETCEYVKMNMPLQKGFKTHEECSEIWEQNNILKKLIELMCNVLSLDLEARIKAMTHLERELGLQSSKESDIARHEFMDALDELRRTRGAKIEDQVTVQQCIERVNRALEKIDSISLGLEHFFREIGKLYEIVLANNPEMNRFTQSAKSVAELLISGQAIELLDGDSGTISGPWLNAICDNVYQQIPKMRVFVISILGLQSSGKSTLLNAMFGCKFAVSVGRCTRGLFMRLLFLDESMKRNLNFDAILLIDTEGLGAPEKQNEADAERKDRLLATFAMGVSHLTIVNVLGEYMRDLTEILQIAIVAMTRLEKADISPNILMVQHLTERNTEKVSRASEQFGKALENAINISDEKDVNLGVKNSKCLITLRQTIAMGKLFRQFRPFKNGASVYSPPSEEFHQDVVELYNSIINIAQESKFRADFKQWQALVQSYWESIKSENFMRFKDIKDLQEFLQRGDIISKVKQSIESSFREHSEILRSFLSEQARKMNEKIVTRESIINELEDKLKDIPNICPSQPSCIRCNHFIVTQFELYAFEENKPSEHATRITIHNFTNKIRYWYFKQLCQSLDAFAFGQIESSNNFERIEKRLREELKSNKKYTDNEIQIIAESIWCDIEKEASERVTQVNVIEQIENEIATVYEGSPEYVREMRGNVISTLNNIPAISKNTPEKFLALILRESDTLDPCKANELEKKLGEIPDILLNEENVQNYQTGMVAELKKKVNIIISEFEKNNPKLKTEFKWKLHAFASQKLRIKMLIKQNDWDQKNNPLIVLQKNKSQYLEVIFERLKYGFDYNSDGMIAGNCLLNAIKQKAIEAGNRKRIDEVLGIDWLTNSESVRLKYFYEMADEIRKENFEGALKHFRNPKWEIEEWFKKQVNNFSTGKENIKFSETFKAEIEQVIQEVRNSSSIIKIKGYIDEYISSCDGVIFDFGLDSSKAKQSDVIIFKNRLIEVLNDNMKLRNITSNIHFISPSCDKEVMDRLGCTNSCPLCSALCWGQRGHDEDSGETKKHHTCHQPMGLLGVRYLTSKKLSSDCCHDPKNSDGWEEENKIYTWDEMRKLNEYKDWKYEPHINNKFNELMKWFFYNLHEKIAKEIGTKPAKKRHLKEYGMYDLDIGSIMAAINDKIK